MNLDINDYMSLEKNTVLDIKNFCKEAKELKDLIERKETDDKNFINELAKEFNIPKDKWERLQYKIYDYLEEITCGEVLYIGYDLNTNTYYQDNLGFKQHDRFELTKEEAEEFGIGTIYTLAYDGPGSGASPVFTEADYAKEAIRVSIKQQLSAGKNIDDINLFEISDDYKKWSVISTIYERNTSHDI